MYSKIIFAIKLTTSVKYLSLCRTTSCNTATHFLGIKTIEYGLMHSTNPLFIEH